MRLCLCKQRRTNVQISKMCKQNTRYNVYHLRIQNVVIIMEKKILLLLCRQILYDPLTSINYFILILLLNISCFYILFTVESAINHLKCGKAFGPDDIRNEFIKYEKQNLKFVLNQLFNVIYDTGIYPDKWSTGAIVPIYKKGDKDDPAILQRNHTHVCNEQGVHLYVK